MRNLKKKKGKFGSLKFSLCWSLGQKPSIMKSDNFTGLPPIMILKITVNISNLSVYISISIIQKKKKKVINKKIINLDKGCVSCRFESNFKVKPN